MGTPTPCLKNWKKKLRSEKKCRTSSPPPPPTPLIICFRACATSEAGGGPIKKTPVVPPPPPHVQVRISAYESHHDCNMHNTLLKSDVTSPDHVVRCRGSQECRSRFVNFACQFHWRWHSLRITLKSTTMLFMRSSNVWTTKPWQRSEWPLDF